MKRFSGIFTIMFLTFLICNLNAQETLTLSADNGSTSSLYNPHCTSPHLANTLHADLFPRSEGQSPGRVSLTERVIAQRKSISGTPSNNQSTLGSGPRKTAAPSAQVYLPDSLILYAMSDTLRMSASYDLRGWNDQILVQIWWGGHWVNYSRQTWTYLGSNENNLTLEQMWLNGQWTNSTLDSSTYDANGNMLVHLFKCWSGGAWKDSILSSRTYDANGNMLTNEGWYMINHQWTNNDRTTYTYDISGNRLSSLLQFWVGGVWVNYDLINFTYDLNGHMLTETRQVWNGQQWDYATLSTYTYDANGNMQSWLFQISASGHWTNSTIHTYTYNANDKILTDWLKGWTNESWMNGSLDTYTYDANGNMLNEVLQEWLNGMWTNFRQSTFTYDAHGNEVTGNNTMWSGSSWAPTDYNFVLAVSGSTYNFNGYRIIISWILVNTTDVSEEMVNVARGYSLSQNYPNPFNPSTEIRYQTPEISHVSLKVFDVLGREVATLVDGVEDAGYKSVQWNASGVASGVYFYRLLAGEFVATRKMLLVR